MTPCSGNIAATITLDVDELTPGCLGNLSTTQVAYTAICATSGPGPLACPVFSSLRPNRARSQPQH